jgi:ABC-type multidrug transport system fused ATPase/permease subunit
MNGASITGLVNAEARTEEEIKRNVRWVFGGLLAFVWLVDLSSSFVVVWLSCGGRSNGNNGNDNEPDDDSRSKLTCVVSSAFRHGNDDDGDDKLGDFWLLALIRCFTNALLLLAGVRFGKEGFPQQRESPDEDEPSGDEGLTEPLLGAGHPDDDDDDAGATSMDPTPDAAIAAADESAVEAQGRPERPDAEAEDESDENGNADAEVNDRPWWNKIGLKGDVFWIPKRTRTIILLLVFLSCTVYQVYAGLRVATMKTGHNQNPDNSLHGWLGALRTLLVCLTVLWINAEAYIIRVLVLELTRKEEGLLFLPPEVHRHPLYLETDRRSMALHWCDLCQQRISAKTTATCTVASDGNNKKASKEGWCYRCALCDFDICIPCSKRNDAATVGENVLRGDRGVRAETSLTTSQYVKRSISVAGRSEWPWLLASFCLLAVSSLTKLFLPHFQGRIIDKVIPIPYHPGSGGDDDNDDDGDHEATYYDKKGFLHYIFIYVLVMLAQGAVSTLYSAIFTLVSRRLKFTIRNALLEKILAQDVAYFDGTESGRLISRLTNDLDMMMAPIQSSLSNLLSNCLVLIGGMAMCFVKSYRLSMLAFVCIGPISYLWEQYALWSKKLAREMLSYWAQGNSIASQALSHIRTVKAFGCEDVVLKQYSETNQMALNCGIKDAWGNGLTSALTGYLDLGTGVLILYFGGLLVYRGEMTVGDLVTYQLFWNMMNNAYQNLQGLVTSFTRSAAGAEKVFSLWDSDPDIDPQKGSDVSPDEIAGHLQLKGVSFYYQMRPDHTVLEDFDLDIPAGKTLALVGRSGGGKSTIINLLLRFYDPREGTVLLDGKPYDSFKVHQLRRLFGVVTQDTELFALTVEENIAYGLDKDDYTFEEVVEAAKKAYAHDFICQMKDGYQTRIGERGGRISGGQRQRLAIARVFLRKPRIILLDEATSALDENSQEAVQKALAVLIEESQSTVVMVAHRLSTVVNADSICVIDKGRVLEQGNHQELANKPGGIYASMVSKQLSKQGDFLDQEHRHGASKGRSGPSGSTTPAKATAVDTIDDLLADGS